MSAPSILVTIRGPQKMVDVELPGDVPVQELMPFLLEMCGPPENNLKQQAQAAASLQVADARMPIDSHLTLVDAQVFDGTVLVLQMNQPSSILPQNLSPRHFLPKSVKPGVDTGGIGVTWDRLT